MKITNDYAFVILGICPSIFISDEASGWAITGIDRRFVYVTIFGIILNLSGNSHPPYNEAT